jgi:tetratricopeptide (TPR) repeat protein
LIYQLIASRQFDQAIEHCREALKTEPSFLIQTHLWRALNLDNRLEEAWVECKKLFTLFIDREIAEAMEIGYAESGYKGAMRTAALKMAGQAETTFIPTTMIASLFAHAEDNDQALNWLERAYEERDQYFYSIGLDPDWDGMRSNPRFTALLKKAGLGK